MTFSPYSDSLSLGLRIDFLNPATPYKSPAHSSTGTRSESKILPLLVSERFHVLFHSPTGVLFTFPSRYYFAIGHSGVFSLTRWSSQIHTGFHVPHATRDLTVFKLLTTGLSPSLVQDSAASSRMYIPLCSSHYLFPLRERFRLFPFRSPLLRESRLLSFPLATKMFQFARFPLVPL